MGVPAARCWRPGDRTPGRWPRRCGRPVTTCRYSPRCGTATHRSSLDTHWARPLDLSPTYFGVYNQEAAGWGAFFGELYSTNILWADAVREEHRRQPFDVVAVHDWLAAPAGLTLAQHLDVPIVLHVHSAEWGRQPGGPSPIVSQWETAAGRAAAATITVSHAMVRDLIAHGWDPQRVHGVWNGVDTELYAPDLPGGPALRARYGLPDDAPVVFFIGRLTGVKGARPLMEAWPQVLAQHPEARLVSLGTGDQDDEIRGLVAELGIKESVTLRTEWIPEAERIAHFSAADLVVLPSTYEPFGIVCLEAMACGKPVVVGARGGGWLPRAGAQQRAESMRAAREWGRSEGHCLGDQRGAE